MKALVAGGAGYIGSHTCKLLAKNGHEVLVYDNLSTGYRDFARWGDFVHGDVCDTQKLREVFRAWRPDVVINFAGYINVGESVRNPGKYFRNNVVGVLSMLEAMRDEDVRNIVVSGTCAVYGVPERMPIVESMPTAPINPYGATKLFMEQMLGDFERAHNLNWMSLRYFNAAGSDPEGEIGELHVPETHLIPRVIMAAMGVQPAIEIFGADYPTADGTCVRDYVHVDDLARAHILAAGHLINGGASMAVNLGTGQGASIREIVGRMEKLCGHKIAAVDRERRAGDSPCLVADAALARNVLGWQAEKDLDNMLADAWNFLRTRGDFLRKSC